MKDGKVKLKITGWQTTGQESDTVESEAEGTYAKVDDGCILRYVEEVAEGMKVENEVTASLKRAVVSKKGVICSEMEFVPGEERMIAYQTPYGTIDMKTKCDSISCYEDETEAHVMISYSLYSGEGIVAYCKTLLEVSPV